MLCRTAVRFTRDEAAAEDLVQDTFASLWTKRSRISTSPNSVAAYLRTAVRNRSLNYLRDRKRIPVDDADPTGEASHAGPRPDTALETAELQQRINRAIDRLPERCRLVFVMSRIEQMSHQEIAEGLRISPKTVENQMTRAYRFLREWLVVVLWLIVRHYV
jgi:RNA polymerase sigma-70 factor (ECF subfamily)